MKAQHLKRLSITFLILSQSNPTTVVAQNNTAEIDKIFNWATSETPGCVCAVSQNGKLVFNRAYGAANLEEKVPLTTNSVFDAGSLVKQFVAASTLKLVEEGQLSLSDDVQKYIPELPDYGFTITVDHLLTHTSGLRDWTGIQKFSEGKEDALTLVLRQRSLDFIPGEEWAYSNSGYVLLKEIIARKTGMTFAEFTKRRLFNPLGMKSTLYTDEVGEVKNRALGYDKKGGNWKQDILLENDRGGVGALFSTAEDLIIWNNALTNGYFGTYVTSKLKEPAILSNGRKLNYARGLFLDENRGGKVIWHTGSAAGYKSALSHYPETGLSIAIMCNSGDGTDRIMFARQIFDLLVPATFSQKDQDKVPTPTQGGVTIGGMDLNSRTGMFFNKSGEPLQLVVEEGWLRVAAGPRLVALSNNHFKRLGASLQFMSQDEFELRFLANDKLELKSMEGETTMYRRAIQYVPAKADITGFTGRYRSDEIGAEFIIEAGEKGIIVRISHAPDKNLEFKPIDTDAFGSGRMMVRFRRDKTGKVIAFDYGNPVLRKVSFAKVSSITTKS